MLELIQVRPLKERINLIEVQIKSTHNSFDKVDRSIIFVRSVTAIAYLDFFVYFRHILF
jgi:hypothetical protein